MQHTGSSAKIRAGKYVWAHALRNTIEICYRFLAAEEEVVTPYRFGVYDLLVLPPSFPYGGMVCSTFLLQLLFYTYWKTDRKMPVSPSSLLRSWQGIALWSTSSCTS